LKVLEVESLQAGIENAVKDIDKMSEQLSAVQRAVRDFHSLDDALKGQGGEAIRSFYKDCHEPFLIYLHQSFIDYKTILNEMKEAIDSFEANPSGYVKQEYLESDVEDGLDTVENTTVELTADANSIIDSISDLVAIKSIDESEVVDNVGRGKEKSAEVVEELNILDDYSTSRLEETK